MESRAAITACLSNCRPIPKLNREPFSWRAQDTTMSPSPPPSQPLEGQQIQAKMEDLEKSHKHDVDEIRELRVRNQTLEEQNAMLGGRLSRILSRAQQYATLVDTRTERIESSLERARVVIDNGLEKTKVLIDDTKRPSQEELDLLNELKSGCVPEPANAAPLTKASNIHIRGTAVQGSTDSKSEKHPAEKLGEADEECFVAPDKDKAASVNRTAQTTPVELNQHAPPSGRERGGDTASSHGQHFASGGMAGHSIQTDRFQLHQMANKQEFSKSSATTLGPATMSTSNFLPPPSSQKAASPSKQVKLSETTKQPTTPSASSSATKTPKTAGEILSDGRVAQGKNPLSEFLIELLDAEEEAPPTKLELATRYAHLVALRKARILDPAAPQQVVHGLGGGSDKNLAKAANEPVKGVFRQGFGNTFGKRWGEIGNEDQVKEGDVVAEGQGEGNPDARIGDPEPVIGDHTERGVQKRKRSEDSWDGQDQPRSRQNGR